MTTGKWIGGAVVALAVVGCESVETTSAPEDELFLQQVSDMRRPALIPMDVEMTRSHMFTELRRARNDLAILKGAKGSDYARQWNMTLDQALTQARQAIRFWSQSLGPFPVRPTTKTTQADASCAATPPEDIEDGMVCWWFEFDDHDDGGWWVLAPSPAPQLPPPPLAPERD